MKNTDQNNPEYRVQFLSLVEKHSAATANGESAKANRLHKQLHKLYAEVRDKKMTELFQEFLHSKDPGLQMWSAVFSLNTDPENAVPVLTALTETDNINAQTAKILLHLWKENKLELL